MKAITQVHGFTSFDVELETTISGSILDEFLARKKEIDHPDALGVAFDEAEIVDEILDGKLDKFIYELIKNFEKESNLIVQSYGEPEMENIPQNMEATKNLNIKIKLLLQCKLSALNFKNEKTIN